MRGERGCHVGICAGNEKAVEVINGKGKPWNQKGASKARATADP